MSEFDEKLNALLSNPESMAQIMQLAQSLGVSGGGGTNQGGGFPGGGNPGGGDGGFSGGADFLSSLTGGLDPKLLSRLLPMIRELGSGQDSNAAALMRSLRPYLKQERQEKVERALQLARLMRIGKQFLAERGGKTGV